VVNKKKTMITTNSIKEYIEKNNVRKMVRWRLHDGKWFFELFPGFWQHEQSFDRFFPQYEYKKNPNENPDGTYVK